jgi:hypothetical protein
MKHALSNKGKYVGERTNQDHCTPDWLIDAIEDFMPIACDPCSNPWSLVNALLTYSKHRGEDGLASPWPEDKLTYINPPFGNIGPWVERSNMHAIEYPKATIIMVSPFTPETEWFEGAWNGEASGLTAWWKRVVWEGAGNSPPQATAGFYWGPDSGLFFEWARGMGCPIFGRVRRIRVPKPRPLCDPRQLPLFRELQ